jgi:ribonucleotide reductase alpha subunit
MTIENNKDSFKKMRDEILRRRYLWKDKDGIVEIVEQMYRRVANTITAVESIYGATKTQVKAWANKFF